MTWKLSGCVGIVDPIAHHPPLRFLSADFRVAVGLNDILGIFADSPALSSSHRRRLLLKDHRATSATLNHEVDGGGGEEDEDYDDNEDDDGV